MLILLGGSTKFFVADKCHHPIRLPLTDLENWGGKNEDSEPKKAKTYKIANKTYACFAVQK